MKYILIFTLALCFGCNEDEHDKKWDLRPNTALTIGFKDTLDFNSKYPLNRMSGSPSKSEPNLIYYFKDSEKHYLEAGVIKNGGLNIPFQYPYYSFSVSNDLNTISAIGGYKLFYIDWPNGQTDTLYANYRSDLKGPNECNCSEPLVELTLNGKPFIEKTDYSINGVYVFE